MSESYVRNQDVLQAKLAADEIALLSVNQAKYFGLDGPAARIWELLSSPHSIDELCQELEREFEVSQEQCLRDTEGFITELLDASLIKLVPHDD